MQNLTPEQIEQRRATELPAWSYRDGHLERTYRTGRWPTTLLLAGAIAFLAEAAFHHPDLLLQYDRLTVRLQTHDAGGITEKDFALARAIESLATSPVGPEDVFEGPPYSWIS